MERLTLALLVQHGHAPILWSNDALDVPDGVELRALPRDVLPPIGFAGKPHPHIPSGGIGSLAHWSDYFAFEVLHRFGGVWVQMDCAVTARLELPDYTFSGWKKGISPVVMSIPRGSVFAEDMARILRLMLVDGMAGRDWHDAMKAIHDGLRHHRIRYSLLSNYVDCGGVEVSPYTHPIRADAIHWSNATHHTSKEWPTAGSEYERLCVVSGLIGPRKTLNKQNQKAHEHGMQKVDSGGER
jgi:hypothetical protein